MDLHGNNEDVRFDHAAADRLRGSLRAAAEELSAQQASRAAWQTEASRDFRGRYADMFMRNASTASRDAEELATKLRLAQTLVEQLASEARDEQARRNEAREWAKRYSNRNPLEQFWDWLFGDGEPPAAKRSPNPMTITANIAGSRER